MVSTSWRDSTAFKWTIRIYNAISYYTWNNTIRFTLYSIFFVTVFGLVMWYVGVQKIGASHTMVYMYITPLVAVYLQLYGQMNTYRFNK